MTSDIQAPETCMNPRPILKIVLALVCIAAVLVTAGADLYPEIPSYKVLAYAACAAFLVLALAVLTILAGQKLNLFTLNHGGTDQQWIWFSGEPPGLQRERERAARQALSQDPVNVRRAHDQDGD
jgi:hypothetical protein